MDTSSRRIMPTAIRVSLVEDHDPTRAALATILRGTPGFQCVSEHRDADEALRDLPVARPDVVLMDLEIPGMSGAEVIRRLRSQLGRVLFLAYTQHDAPERVFEALKAGAHGYLLKATPPAELLEAIRDALNGDSPMSPGVARLVIRHFHETVTKPSDALALTSRESEVIELIARGHTQKEIASRLNASRHTVHNHLRHIYEKLHVRNATEAVSKYRETQTG